VARHTTRASSRRGWCAPLLLSLLASGCYLGGARPFDRSALSSNRDWITTAPVPEILQQGERDCGAAAAAMLLGYWGFPTEQSAVRAASALPGEQALPATFLRTYLKSRGLVAFLIQGTLADLEGELRAGHPVIVGVVKPYLIASYAHYLVVVGLNRVEGEIAVVDPADGWRSYSFDAFGKEWVLAHSLTIVVSRDARLQ